MNIEYIAGYFDGEGHITITNLGCILCRVRATYKPVLIELQNQFGGSIRFEPKVKPSHKQIWTWCVTAQKAEMFLKEIEPFLGEKGEQARVALAYQKRRDMPISDTQQEFLARMWQELKDLKQQEFIAEFTD